MLVLKVSANTVGLKVKDVNRVSGGACVICPFFEEIDAILGTHAASTPSVLLQSDTSSQDQQEQPNGLKVYFVMIKHFFI